MCIVECCEADSDSFNEMKTKSWVIIYPVICAEPNELLNGLVELLVWSDYDKEGLVRDAHWV